MKYQEVLDYILKNNKRNETLEECEKIAALVMLNLAKQLKD